MSHPDVAVAAAIGIPHEIYGEVVWLVVVSDKGDSVDLESVQALCDRQLADFKRPRRLLLREQIPMSRIGKIDRVRLRTELLEES